MITPSFSLTATERVLPKLALDFTTASLDSRVTFTRADATATRVNASGFIESVAADTPRFDYNPVTLVCKGLLIEESRQNGLTYSEDFTAATGAWVNTRANATSAAGTSPDGLNTANLITEDSTATNSHFLERSFSFTAGVAYTLSAFFKPNGRQWVRLFFSSTAFGTNTLAFFDCQNGVVGVTANSPTTTIEKYADGWYRCSISKTATVTVSAPIRINLASADNTVTYTGNGTSGAYVWGAQLEAGAFATSYIPTTTTALTRNADVATMTGTNFSDWFNASEGAFNIQFMFNGAGASLGANRNIFAVSDGSANNAFAFYTQIANSRFRLDGYDNGATQFALTYTAAGAPSAGTLYDLCLAYKLNSFAGAINGNAVSTDASGTVPPNQNNLVFGASGSGALPLNGVIQKFSYYPQRLIDNEVRTFSK